ncbi:MAG: DUF177 domain-containing protein [Oscillospiraceae bacterium]|nr:DUF177 domain-containing protein [Oscillospiraceae bacterium]
MRINIESVRKKEAANSIKFDYRVEESEKNNYKILLGAKEVGFINIIGEISQKNGLVAIDYEIEANFLAECARCGKETWQTVETGGEKYIADKSEEDEKAGGDFYFTETDGILELSDFIVEFLGVEIPYRYLCFDDCQGLCQKCGKDLNEGGCSCQKKEKNPAFKILDDFFEKKE